MSCFQGGNERVSRAETRSLLRLLCRWPRDSAPVSIQGKINLIQDSTDLSAQNGPPDPKPYSPTLGQRILAALGRMMIRLLGRTLRYEVIGEEHLREARENSPDGHVALAFWHGRQLPLVYLWRGNNVAILTSLSRDGTLQSLVMDGLGFHIVRGSTSRGAVRGLVGIIRAVKEGHDTAFAVDGPRGPHRIAQQGILFAARKTGIPVVPMTFAARRVRVFEKAWDKYILPLPFTRVVIAYDEGFMVPDDSDTDYLSRRATELGELLDNLTAEAEEVLRT